jgi:hypothetical protein
MALESRPWPLYRFLNSIHSRQDPLDGRSARRKAATYIKNTTNTQTFMPRVGFEPKIPVFVWPKPAHALDRAATLLGKGKGIPVTGREGPQGCETSRLPHFLGNRLQMAVRLSALRAGPILLPRKIRGTHFCWRLSRPHGHSAAERITSTKKPNGLIGNRTHGLPACSIVPQPATLLRAPCILHIYILTINY